MHPAENDDASSGGGRPLMDDSTKEVLVSLGITLNFIYSWLQSSMKIVFRKNIYRVIK